MSGSRQATVRLRVPFCDVDPMQVVWHGNYFKYFDCAREALFDEAGLDLTRMYADQGLAFPVTRSQAKHVRPLRFRDEFECSARVTEVGCRIVIDFEIHLVEGGTLCTRGQTEQVAVRLPDGTLELSLPDFVTRALGSDARTTASVPQR
jgi:acyl-CoA thioester hydrolase